METSRRAFLFGMGAALAATALPLPLVRAEDVTLVPAIQSLQAARGYYDID